MGILRTLGTYIMARILFLLICAGVVAGGIALVGSRSRRVDFVRRMMANRAVREMVFELQERYPNKSFAVFDFTDDYKDAVTKRLRRSLDKAGKSAAVPVSKLNKALKALGLSDGVTSSESAAKAARKVNADIAIYGRVEEFSRDGTHGSLRVEVRAADALSGKEVLKHTVAAAWPASMSDRVVTLGAGWRLLIWVFVAAGLPLVCHPLARSALERESNLLTFLLLLGLTILDVAAALFLLGFSVHSFWTALLVIGALAGSGIYNYAVLNAYEKMRA